MNFIVEPRQRNDIAPFGFLAFACFWMFTFFGKPFGWILIAKEVMRPVCNVFVDWVSRTEEMMCTIFKTFFCC